jgi:hypothetical protein
LLILSACKNNTKEENTSSQSKTLETAKQPTTFEDNLIDLREINQQFLIGYKVEKFGVQKLNDSIYEFVFKVDKNTTAETVNMYSVGIKAFDSYLDKPLLFSRSPELKSIEENKYIFIKNNFKNIKYLDSIEAYIYARNNWKASGKLGAIKVKDIFFEDK